MNELAKNILSIIAEIGGDLVEFIKTPPGKLRLYKIPKTTYYNTLANLENNGLVERKKNGRQYSYIITSKGRQILRKPIVKKNRTDGLSTIIIFDIPEEKSKERTVFRRFLKNNGYINLQKSVLIAPFELSDDVQERIGELGIRKNISIIEGKIKYNF